MRNFRAKVYLNFRPNYRSVPAPGSPGCFWTRHTREGEGRMFKASKPALPLRYVDFLTFFLRFLRLSVYPCLRPKERLSIRCFLSLSRRRDRKGKSKCARLTPSPLFFAFACYAGSGRCDIRVRDIFGRKFTSRAPALEIRKKNNDPT